MKRESPVMQERGPLKAALYELVEGRAERYEALAYRAERGGDDELAEFFLGAREEEARRTARARELLAQRVAE